MRPTPTPSVWGILLSYVSILMVALFFFVLGIILGNPLGHLLGRWLMWPELTWKLPLVTGGTLAGFFLKEVSRLQEDSLLGDDD